MQLSERSILITGAASGIGRSTVELFIDRGASVTAVDSNSTGLKEFLSIFANHKVQLIAVEADVSLADEVDSAVQAACDRFGKLDGIVNVAGVDLIAPLCDTTLEDWNRVMSVNLTGPYLVCRAALPILRTAGGGTIVNVSSAAALRPLEQRSAYCASKAGLVAFGKSLAIEVAGDGIRVNTICPGVVDTQMLRVSYQNAKDPEAVFDRIKARNVMNRVADPKEIAMAALYLSCEDSAFVTGIALAVDGGRSFH